jgi:hypothetical protein
MIYERSSSFASDPLATTRRRFTFNMWQMMRVISSNHPYGANVACGDGRCRLINGTMTAIQLRAHATIAGRETTSSDW